MSLILSSWRAVLTQVSPLNCLECVNKELHRIKAIVQEEYSVSV